jgi:hypothetical protein
MCEGLPVALARERMFPLCSRAPTPRRQSGGFVTFYFYFKILVVHYRVSASMGARGAAEAAAE